MERIKRGEKAYIGLLPDNQTMNRASGNVGVKKMNFFRNFLAGKFAESEKSRNFALEFRIWPQGLIETASLAQLARARDL